MTIPKVEGRPVRKRRPKYPPITDEFKRAMRNNLSLGWTKEQELADRIRWEGYMELAVAFAARRDAKALESAEWGHPSDIGKRFRLGFR